MRFRNRSRRLAQSLAEIVCRRSDEPERLVRYAEDPARSPCLEDKTFLLLLGSRVLYDLPSMHKLTVR